MAEKSDGSAQNAYSASSDSTYREGTKLLYKITKEEVIYSGIEWHKACLPFISSYFVS